MADVFDVFKKTMMTGIGLALKTKDEVDAWAKELVTRGELSENEGEKFVDELTKRYEEAREGFEVKVEKTVKDLMKKWEVPTAEDFKKLREEVNALKKTAGQSGDGAKDQE